MVAFVVSVNFCDLMRKIKLNEASHQLQESGTLSSENIAEVSLKSEHYIFLTCQVC